MNPTYAQSIRTLNKAAWDAIRASKGVVTSDQPEWDKLRQMCRDTDRMVDDLPSAVLQASE